MNTSSLQQIDTLTPAKNPHRKRFNKRSVALQHEAEFSLMTRFRYGSFGVGEICSLANVSTNKFYLDRKAGLVTTFKRGNSTAVAGPVAAKYLGIDLEK